ncbi:cyclic nucleotide-binding domain-containing protein [Salinisphaera sp. LB1]|uniref:helix-turn-helix domain-containing protein n=1 Tax=Salinisphaera sp. LB1 TaxID=2183911 RepID=UPI000D705EE9|nr:cyclic nucleotide-binding domain-containing protein [Salinisphaera sp. LB1]AWN15161.1 Fumarate and nitrate reduction regulatory protein [Salinisphaera sp. LB1]
MPATFRHLDNVQQACGRCSLAHLCLPYGLGTGDIQRLETLVDVGRPLARGTELFAQGDRLSALYAVGSGAMKTSMIDAEGLEQIMGFYYPGDLLGLDGMGDEVHHCTATALEDSQICRIPFDQLDQLVDEVPGLRRQLMRLMSHALSDDEQLLLTLGRKSSEGRIATLLLSLSRRREMRGLPASPIRLSMKRADLANFLGMRIETVSRVLRRLQECRIIAVDRADVAVLDFDALEAWATRGAWVADQ